MIKIKKSVFVTLAGISSVCLTACGKKADVTLWGSFGSKYSTILTSLVDDISKELGIKVAHVSQGSYPGVRKEMINAIANSKYPELVVGYPDHFAQYQGSKILRQLDGSVTGEWLKDYDEDYMPENYLYDQDGTQHLYGVPFNKSTELLGYNGVFVDYCDELYPGEGLKELPKTWGEWAAAKSDPTSKAGRYLSTFQDLVANHKVMYATQETDGTAHDFTPTPAEGKVKVFDYKDINITDTKLMSWDSTDNAFITLVRQWDSHYTELPEDQRTVAPKRRLGKILFANEANLDKTLKMLKFFNHMYKDEIFGTPGDIGGKFSSEAFARGCVMFMVCSSGGLSYNTSKWENRFRVAPIPYKDEDHKFVISQGANICLTKKGDEAKALKVLKALTSGKFQTRWAIETGYFPAAKSAEDDDDYINFMNDTSYSDKTMVAYREGAKVNHKEYRGKAHIGEEGWKAWTRFVDDAFIGSATIRDEVAKILPNVLKNVAAAEIDDDLPYKAQLKTILTGTTISQSTNIQVDCTDPDIMGH